MINQLLDRSRKTHRPHVGFIEAGQNRHGQNFGTVPFLHGGAQDGIVTMHGHERGSFTLHFPDRQGDGFRYVEKFQIDHDLMATIQNQVDHWKPARQEQLQADFIKANSIAQADRATALLCLWNPHPTRR
ncbi:MAG: hypothetical protein MZV65_00725 [Chromatiales bacterium]|nr:hypothetical protein [Chromatiales bacterium]